MLPLKRVRYRFAKCSGALVQASFACGKLLLCCVGQGLAGISNFLPLVGEPVALICDPLTFVRKPVALVCHDLALIGRGLQLPLAP